MALKNKSSFAMNCHDYMSLDKKSVISDKKDKAEGSMMCVLMSNKKSGKLNNKYKSDHCKKM